MSSIASTTPIAQHSKVGDEGHAPKHVAVIMDGNGRWAQARGLPRIAGHKEGVEALRKTVDACKALAIEHLTVFSFSTENWRRPKAEVDALFALLKLFVKKDLNRLHKEGVRVRIFGSLDGLPADILKLIDECESKTAQNKVFNVNIAFNYGGRAEIVEAAQKIAADVQAGRLSPESIDESIMQQHMWSSDLPDVDLLIRTSGELRISNFLLWGIAYSELMFLDILWPDFGKVDMERAIDVFKNRNRRFGGVEPSKVIES
ncbi:isoprenyl transferase [Hirschia baltica]|uniref:Isoprenyl transferase n=1 Tax=Hirschia baltica (strain ATCC 49814 / DSM 5838 / IFAM 1418) TaxID=582402 RepID=C6XJV6_HIRBI|nr:isoprenyl transferase [Hirschia baltica]ACT59401.1 undecaprenyl diphosphate synthase [Hirschia baltica ATCC 49814]